MIDDLRLPIDNDGEADAADPFPVTVELPEEEEHVESAMVCVVPAVMKALDPRRACGRPPVRHILPEPLDPRLVVLTAPESRRAESFRHLRDELLARSVPRVLAVTSAAPGEGKTTCAINLSLALAERLATDVLLVDGNFNEPSFAEMWDPLESTCRHASLSIL